MTQICVDEDYPAPRASQGDGEIRDSRRLSLRIDGARDHDRSGTVLGVGEIEAPPEGAELLGVAARGVGEHDEVVALSKTGRGLSQTSEKTETEGPANGVDRPDSRVESIREKHDDQCKDETEAEGEQAVPQGSGGRPWAPLRRDARPAPMASALRPGRPRLPPGAVVHHRSASRPHRLLRAPRVAGGLP